MSKSLGFKHNSTGPKAQVLATMLGCLQGDGLSSQGGSPIFTIVSTKDSVFRLQSARHPGVSALGRPRAVPVTAL